MRKFAEEYDANEIGQQAVDQLLWGHIVMLIYTVPEKMERLFYIKETLQNRWSRNVLSMQIERYQWG
jgi:predicted nuclease of restriction endonuclease-like (RecB) superfamily